MTLGEFIRYRIGVLGINQRQLAHETGLYESRLSQIVNDRTRYLPEPAEMAAIATALKCSQQDLLTAAGYLQPEESEQGEPATLYTNPVDEARHKLRSVDDLPPNVRRAIDDVLRLADDINRNN